MYSSNAFTIRIATDDDVPALRRLAALDSRPAVARPALIGEIRGTPAAALSLVDGATTADPFVPTAALSVGLRMRADGILAHEREPSLAARIRAALLPLASPRPHTA